MDENISIVKVLESIAQSCAFDQLESFLESKKSETLSRKEKELLGGLFILQAEDLLKAHPDSVIHKERAYIAIERATEVAPFSAAIWYKKAMILSKDSEEDSILQAFIAFQEATTIQPDFFEAFYAWANLLAQSYITTEEPLLLSQAEEMFTKAEKLLPSPNNLPFFPMTSARFYWHFGLVHFMISRRSQEASDISAALMKYQKAKSFGLETDEFYNDYANALVEIGLLTNRKDLFFEAITYYQLSIEDKPEGGEEDEYVIRYFNLGTCYHYLFSLEFKKEHFDNAEEFYKKAASIVPSYWKAWYKWGQLLLDGHRLWHEPTFLKPAVEKLSEAMQLSENVPMIVAYATRALALLGTYEEDLYLLQKAEEFLKKALKEEPQLIELLVSYGFLLMEMGSYFSDEAYYEAAIDKLEEAATLSEPAGFHLHLLAKAKNFLYEYQNDPKLVKDALHLFEVASTTDCRHYGAFYNDWGIACLQLANISSDKRFLEKAEEQFEKAVLVQDKISVDWLFNYGTTLSCLGDLTDDERYYEKAAQALLAAVAADDSFTPAHLQLGTVYADFAELTQDKEFFYKAQAQFLKVIEQDPEDDAAYNELGITYLHLSEHIYTPDNEENRELQLAEENFFKALRLGNEAAYYNLSCLYCIKDNLPDAIQFFEKALSSSSLPPIEDIMHDDWLSKLRQTPYFKEFLQDFLAGENDNT